MNLSEGVRLLIHEAIEADTAEVTAAERRADTVQQLIRITCPIEAGAVISGLSEILVSLLRASPEGSEVWPMAAAQLASIDERVQAQMRAIGDR